ncbi:glycosyltransferase [Clostridium chrysemydis]|uniref:glycosyltransferase n=1 Tax=Clostridium chrysemydis TaxID=2665504 RepID=UPI00188415E7|nr:glycosyltransferase [Clostridium chrysemydis]
MDYSICIRTLGTAGVKFEKLIKSIKKLNIKPKEVIIVIPKGYKFPKVEIDNIKVVYSDKGMLLQRIIGIEEAKSKYVLLLDDDVEFESNILEKLYEPIKLGLCKISFPIYEDLLLKKGIRRLISSLTLSSVPKKYKSEFVKIISSGGYSYNKDLKNSKRFLYSESAPGMCVFGERKALINSSLREELWIDETKYSLRDDAVLIYKNHLIGNKVIGVKDINIKHLDGGSLEKNRNLKASYANTYNQILFWKRFIYDRKEKRIDKIKAKIAICYWKVATYIYQFVSCTIKNDKEMFLKSKQGIKDGFKKISEGNIW